MKTFNADFQHEPVEITHLGVTKKYEIRELTGDQRDTYMNEMLSRMKGKQDNRSLRNVKGLQNSLLAMCMYIDDTPVPLDTIQKWPARVQTALFEEAQKLSGLDVQTDVEKEAVEKIVELRLEIESIGSHAEFNPLRFEELLDDLCEILGLDDSAEARAKND